MVEGAIVGEEGDRGRMPTAREVAALHEQAYQEGFASGREDGYAEGQRAAAADIAARSAALDGIVRDLAQPLATLDEELVESVAELALLIARHLVRRELRAAPGEVVGVVRETLRHLPVAGRATTVRLNPEDVEIVRGALSLGEEIGTWRLEPDPLIARGGCIVETESSRIDASVESRLAAIASRMFGGERESDRGA